MNLDEKYMKRALELAARAIGHTSPNPMVGCVIVKDGVVIGEGYHHKCGELHAERNALKDCKVSAKGATLYVTLEPCCHYGKTPPCTEAIIENNIAKVVVGCVDDNPLVENKGIKILREHGIEVVIGVCEEECKKLNEVFFHYITKKMPYVVMKYAMTLDGRIATDSNDSKWISGVESRLHVQSLRNAYSGIMVGINTVLADNPMLNTRVEGYVTPTRIILDNNLRTPLDSNIVCSAKEISTIIVSTLDCASCDNVDFYNKKEALVNNGVEVIHKPNMDMKGILSILASKGIDSILVEGGGLVHGSLIRENLVDKVYAYIAPKIVGGDVNKAPIRNFGFDKMCDAISLKDVSYEKLGEDICVVGYVDKSKC